MRNALKIKYGHKTGVAWACRVWEKLGKFTKTAILILTRMDGMNGMDFFYACCENKY